MPAIRVKYHLKRCMIAMVLFRFPNTVNLFLQLSHGCDKLDTVADSRLGAFLTDVRPSDGFLREVLDEVQREKVV